MARKNCRVLKITGGAYQLTTATAIIGKDNVDKLKKLQKKDRLSIFEIIWLNLFGFFVSQKRLCVYMKSKFQPYRWKMQRQSIDKTSINEYGPVGTGKKLNS